MCLQGYFPSKPDVMLSAIERSGMESKHLQLFFRAGYGLFPGKDYFVFPGQK